MGRPASRKRLGPFRVGGDEHGDGVHKGHAGIEAGGGVGPLGLLRAHRQVAHQDVRPAVAERLGHVHRFGRGLLDGLAVVLAQAVEGGSSLNGDSELAHRGEADGVVLPGEDGLAQVGPDFGGVDVEGGHELEVTDVVAAEHDVHEPGHGVVGIGVPVVRHPLDEGTGAVPHSGDGHTDVGHGWLPFVFVRASPGRGSRPPARSDRAAACLCRSSSMSRSSQAMSWAVDSVLCSTSERV